MIEKERVSPPVNLIERKNDFYIEVYIPGVREDDLEIVAGDEEVIITGYKKEDYPYPEDRIYHRLEREYGYFRIVLKLPSSFNKRAIKAVLENGVLIITVPKIEEKRRKLIRIPVSRR